jgi:hypothetical protein
MIERQTGISSIFSSTAGLNGSNQYL